MQKVLQQYVEHYVRILFKRRGGEVMTHGEKKAVAYYKAAAQRIEALINAPTPEWVALKFKASRRA
jgi:glucuronate isomerase